MSSHIHVILYLYTASDQTLGVGTAWEQGYSLTMLVYIREVVYLRQGIYLHPYPHTHSAGKHIYTCGTLAPLTSSGHTYCKRKEANQWLTPNSRGGVQTSDPHLTSVQLTQITDTNLSTHRCKIKIQSLYSHVLTCTSMGCHLCQKSAQCNIYKNKKH